MAQLKQLVAESFEALIKEEKLPSPQSETEYTVTPPVKEEFGDFTTNAAMVRAKDFRLPPRKIAELLAEKLQSDPLIKSVEVAGPGFLNIKMLDTYWHEILAEIVENKENLTALYTHTDKPLKILVEFVSANPTGPMHFGHGRGAVVGDVIANLLKAYGHDVTKEYYINDAGNQMENLAKTTMVRYKQAVEGNFDNNECPEGGYLGDYLKEIAQELLEEDGGYKEHDLDWFREKAKEKILVIIKNTLEEMGISFDNWYSELSLYEDGKLDRALDELKESGVLYEKEGALWMNTSDLGDEKDRVVVKSDGEKTYFASDIVYHKEKMERGFDLLVNIWGADHHGYINRLKAALELVGYDRECLKISLVKLVNLKKGGEALKMSKRGDSFITINDVMEEVGKDAARFTFLTRSADSNLDFDLDLAVSKSKENPVYYTQYAFARLNSLFVKAEENELTIPENFSVKDLEPLKEEEEISLIKELNYYPDVIKKAAEKYEPHLLTYYILELSAKLHKFYYNHKVISEAKEVSVARLLLLHAVHAVLKDGLNLLGVAAPERM
ncbi:MAG: arginine--tRNA ligase [Nitrospinae bacterium]|nr:arginine--tRNA ligase [Nitrospinota bacterium]